MNPTGHPAENVQMQGFPGHPAGAPVVQYTTVNVPPEPPKDHIIWSLCCFVYSNPFCLGLAALIFSIKARDRKAVGDLDGARHYASTARCLNICATVIASIGILIFMITIITVTVRTNEVYRRLSTNNIYNTYSYGG